MTNNKTIILKNGITQFLTTNPNSYHTISSQIEHIMKKKLGIDKNIASTVHFHKVYTWAKGAIPKALEMKALAYLKYSNENRWMDMYIPFDNIAINILKDSILQLIKSAYKNPEKLITSINSLNNKKVLTQVNDPKSSLTCKSYALIYKIWNRYIINQSITSDKQLPIFDENTIELVESFVVSVLDQIQPKSLFINTLTNTIRENITLDHFENGTIKSEIKKIALNTVLPLMI